MPETFLELCVRRIYDMFCSFRAQNKPALRVNIILVGVYPNDKQTLYNATGYVRPRSADDLRKKMCESLGDLSC